MNKAIIISALVLIGLMFIFIVKSPSTTQRNREDRLQDSPISLPYSFKNENTEQLSIKAFALNKEKKYKEAIELYQYAIKLEPENPRLWFDLANCYVNMDNLEKAISLLDTAIALDSSCAAFYNNRGLFYYSLHNDQNAIIDLEKAIHLDSSNWVIYLNIALAYYSNNNLQDACIALNTSKLLCPDWTQTAGHTNLEKLNEICK